MVAKGGQVFAAVWASNLWADAIFVVGTVGAFWASALVTAQGGRPTGLRLALGVAAGFVAHYAVYALSAALVGHEALGASPFTAFHFDNEGLPGLVAVLRAGLVGLAAAAFAGPLIGLYRPPSAPHPEDAAETAPGEPK